MRRSRPALATLLALTGCPFPEQPLADPPDPKANVLIVEPRSDIVKAYPCQSQCHDERAVNPERRPLEEFHISKQLAHGPLLLWCFWCHAEDDLDRFRLLDDSTIPFDEAYRVCGQCHGDKLRDWNAGIHGRQTGHWAGQKTRLSCPECHNPHRPQIEAYEAEPPPKLTPRGDAPKPGGAH